MEHVSIAYRVNGVRLHNESIVRLRRPDITFSVPEM